MTCIVGLSDNGKILMGGDSAGVSGWDLSVRADTKVFVRAPFVMGFTTSFRMGQLLRWKLVPPVQSDDMDASEFMCTLFVDAVRECLRNGGFAKKQNEAEEGGQFLVGYRGRIYSIESDYQVGEIVTGFHALGCGAAYALGAIHALNRAAPEKKVRRALEIAESLSTGVRGPFHIVSL